MVLCMQLRDNYAPQNLALYSTCFHADQLEYLSPFLCLSPSSCSSCGCDPAGAQSGSMCDPVTGECMCKEYVMGDTCDACIGGFEMLDAGNPFGCSAGKCLAV